VAPGQLLKEPAFQVIEQTGGWVMTMFLVPVAAVQLVALLVNCSTTVPE
jgi:hypothetical protein